MPCFSSIFDPEVTDYCAWTIPNDDQLVIGAALAPWDRTVEKFERLKSKLCDWGIEVGETVWREGAFLLRPTSVRQISTGARGVALLGEAAGWISPSSAAGLSYAFRSAQILAEVLHGGLEDSERRYHRATLPLRRNILLKSLKSRVVFDPTLRRTVMKLGLQSMTVCALAARRAQTPAGDRRGGDA